MKFILITLNVIAFIWLFFFSPAIPLASDSMRHRQVLELCQSGVIDTNELRRMYPDSAAPEAHLAFVMSHSEGYFRLMIWPAATLALLNVILILKYWHAGTKPSTVIPIPSSEN